MSVLNLVYGQLSGSVEFLSIANQKSSAYRPLVYRSSQNKTQNKRSITSQMLWA